MFEIRVDWEDALGVAIPVLRETWAQLGFYYNRRPMTRFRCNKTGILSECVHVSVYPLARWIVENWEALSEEEAPDPTAVNNEVRERPFKHKDWLLRHNLFAWREGMAYPDLTIYREDSDIVLVWFADPPDTTTLTGHFIDSGSIRIDEAQMKAALTKFMLSFIERTRDVVDDDLEDLRSDWNEIQNFSRRNHTH